MKSKITIVLLITFLITSCSNHQNQPKMISVIDAIGKERVMNLSEIASEVKYIKLETSPVCLIGNIRQPIFENGYFYLPSSNKYCIFNEKGEYIGNMGVVGRGPGEYSNIGLAKIFFGKETGNVFIFSDNKIIEYTKTGKYLREIALNFLNDKDVIISNIFRDKKEFIVCIFNNYNASGDIILIDNNGNLIGEFPKNYELKSEMHTINYGSGYFNAMSTPILKKFGENVRIYNTDNDTIFNYLNGKKSILYIQNFGKFHTPKNCSDVEEMKKYIRLIGLQTVETEKYIFLTYFFGNNLPENIKPQWSRAILDKHSTSLQLLKRPEKDYDGLKNDLDGKFTFWPSYYNSDGYLLMSIPPENEEKNPGIMMVKLSI